MVNEGKLRPGSASVGSMLAVLGVLALLAWVADEPRPANAPPVEGVQVDETAEPDGEPICEAKPDADPQAGGCKPCKNRPWCTCIATIGDRTAPRVSCEPCCYWAPWMQNQYCLD